MRLKFIQKIIDIIRNKKPPVISPKVNICGKHSYISRDSSINREDTIIGSFCSISDGVRIGLAQHPTNYFSTSHFCFDNLNREDVGFVDEPCAIGNDVWIGSDVLIMGGINVGDGAVLAAGAVVTKDVPPYAIVGGVPAKVIRYRFDEETIKELLELKWWDMPDEKIKQIPFNVPIQESIRVMRELRNAEN